MARGEEAPGTATGGASASTHHLRDACPAVKAGARRTQEQICKDIISKPHGAYYQPVEDVWAVRTSRNCTAVDANSKFRLKDYPIRTSYVATQESQPLATLEDRVDAVALERTPRYSDKALPQRAVYLFARRSTLRATPLASPEAAPACRGE